jgi:hypothetical protein
MSKLKLTTNDFIQRSKKIHGNVYDYSKAVYTGRPKKLVLICKIHGEFEQRAGHHLQGQGCRECGLLRMTEYQKTWSESDTLFIEQHYTSKGAVYCSNVLGIPLNTIYHKARSLSLRRNNQPLRHSYVSGRLWSNLISNSKVRGLELNITPDDIYEIYLKQDKKCALTGMALQLNSNAKINDVSVDRINSLGNYTKDNIQLVYKKINQCKMDLSDKDFFNMCKMVYYNLKSTYDRS